MGAVLMKVVEHGSQLDDGPVRWDRADSFPVPADERRMRLDRAHRRGVATAEDGWLYESRAIGPLELTADECARAGVSVPPTLTVWSRVRWEATRMDSEAQDLDAAPATEGEC